MALDDGLRSQIGNAYASGDYNTFNNLLTQNNISQDTLKSSFNLGDSNLANATQAGTLTAYNTTPSGPAPVKFSDPGPVYGGGVNSTPTDTSGAPSPLGVSPTAPNLRDTLGQMYQSKDYSGMQNLINQNGLTSDWAMQNYGLSAGDLNNAKSLGINFAGSPTSTAPTTPTAPNGSATNPFPTLTTPVNNSGSTQMAGPILPTATEGSPDWLKQMNDPQWRAEQLANGNGALEVTDPKTGVKYIPHFSGGGDNPTVDGFRALDPAVPYDPNGVNTFKVLDASGNDTGKTEKMGYVSDWFTTIMPYVVGALATFGVGSTIAGVAGAGAATGTSAMDAASAEASSAANSYGAGTLTDNAAFGGIEGSTPGMTVGADGTTTFGSVDPSLSHVADSGITPGTGLQAPMSDPMSTNLTGQLTGGPGIQAAPGTIPPLNAAGDIGSLASTTGAPGLSSTIASTAIGPFSPTDLAMQSGSLLGPASTAGMTTLSTGLSVPSFPGSVPVSPGASGGTSPTGGTNPPVNPGSATSGLGNILNTLGSIAGGLASSDAQRQSAHEMLDWLKSQQAKIDNLYQPGSPEYNLLMQQMAAKDAAAGRNSQYGERSVELAAKIAQIKAQYTAQLTQGIAGNMQQAFNQVGSSNAGLAAVLGNLTKTDSSGNSALGSTLGSIIQKFT
jgi:hypothetical protein